MVIRIILSLIACFTVFFVGLQVLNVLYVSEDVIAAYKSMPYFNFELYIQDGVTMSMLFLVSMISLILVVMGIGGANIRKFRSQYEKENYTRWMTNRKRKRGCVRVCYNSKGEVTRFRLECLWDKLWYPFATLQNKIADHFLWPQPKKWNRLQTWDSFNGKQHHCAGTPLLAYRSCYFFGKYNKVYYLPSNTHTLFVGSTGRGKSMTFVLTMINSSIDAGESIIVHDTKKELCANTYQKLKDNGYEVIIFDFNTPLEGDCWNPIKLAWDLWCEILEKEREVHPEATFRDCNMSKPIELLSDFALNICYEEDAKQPMWWQGSADMLAGGLILLFEEGNEENINILSVKALFDDQDTLKRFMMKNRRKDDSSWLKLSGYMTMKEVTLASMNAVFNNKIRSLVMNQDIVNMTSGPKGVDVRKLFNQKTAVFLMTQSSKGTFYPLVTAFITQFYEIAVMVAEQQHNKKLKYPYKIYLDELAVLPAFKEIVSMYTVSRGYNITFLAFVQSVSQLANKYGDDITETIIDNNANKIFLGASSDETKNFFVKECGKELYYNKKKKQYEERDLITERRLNLLEKGRSVIVSNEWDPFMIKLPPFYRYSFAPKKVTYDFERRAVFEKISIIDIKAMMMKERKRELDSVGAKKFKGKNTNLSDL
ncbi:MAG: type IV secretory system conjugative DNA transfer family protein [Anaerorhabdus sp.]